MPFYPNRIVPKLLQKKQHINRVLRQHSCQLPGA